MRGFIKDHGIVSAAIAGIVAIIVALIGADKVTIEVGSESKSAQTVLEERPSRTKADPPRQERVSLTELAERGDVDALSAFEGDFGTQSIGGSRYESGVSMLIYPDESGIDQLEVRVKGRFAEVTGVVGIDGDAECVDAEAKVWLADDMGRVLWGPQNVHSQSSAPFSADIDGVVRLSFVQRSLATSPDDCGGANPAWGDVYFES